MKPKEDLELFSRGERAKHTFCGIDENGYGPILGPLIVTIVRGKVRGEPLVETMLDRYLFPIRIEDSKRIFQRSPHSYSGGEIAAHAILNASDLKARSLRELAEGVGKLSWEELFLGCPELARLHPDLRLPQWAQYLKEGQLGDFLAGVQIELDEVRADIVLPNRFNKELKKFDSKALLDLSLFLRLLQGMEEPCTAIVGKIGGMRRYAPFFERLGTDVKEVLMEEPHQSSYRIHLGEKEITIHFLRDGDSLYFPIAFASIVGKYLRELFMLSFNRALGFDQEIPYGSGYRHDRKTFLLIEALKSKFTSERITECLIRSR